METPDNPTGRSSSRVTRRFAQAVSPAVYLEGAPAPRNDAHDIPPHSPGGSARPYDADELQFLKAADAERARRRRLLTLTELLEILRKLGWRKAG